MLKSLHVLRKTGGFLLVFLAFGGTAFGAVPEIDPASATGALTLLAGGIFLLTCRFRRGGKGEQE